MYFDSQAQSFETPLRRERAKLIASAIRQCIRPAHESALEVGCGTGLVGMEFIERFSSMLFVDASGEMIRKVREKIALAPWAEAMQMDLPRESPQRCFDFIFSSMALHHIADTQAMAARLYQLLHPNGTIAIVDLNKVDKRFHAGEIDFDGHHGFDQGELSALLKTVGFSAVQTETFYEGTKDADGTSIPYSHFIAKAEK